MTERIFKFENYPTWPDGHFEILKFPMQNQSELHLLKQCSHCSHATYICLVQLSHFSFEI